MIYLKCPTCSYVLGNRQRIYEQGLEEIESNPNNDEELKLELKQKLLESLGLKRYCCRMRVITYKNKTEIIK
jgi:DNA-directed RNA polymerase subunit N (RpoN/RPB10)